MLETFPTDAITDLVLTLLLEECFQNTGNRPTCL